MEHRDLIVIGAGPAGSGVAIRAARSGASVAVFEKGSHGRDKICGDGLTPRAVGALKELKVEPDSAHRIDGLRMIAGRVTRELAWPQTSAFPHYGAVLPRRALDAHLADAATEAGAEIHWETEALPLLDDDGRVVGVEAGGQRWSADLVVLAAGAQGAAARILGAGRDPNEPFALAIRSYAPSERHDDRHLEACLTLTDEAGVAVPGYGWMFPAGDGTVNIGVGALSTMKGFSKLNLNALLDSYAATVRDSWGLGEMAERPRAWRLPMSTKRRHGPGWLAVGDAAGLINPMNGEGIDYGLESAILAADLFIDNPTSAPDRYDAEMADRYDAFFQMGRRFSRLIGHPRLMRAGLRVAVSSQTTSDITLAVMANLIDPDQPGASGQVMKVADWALGVADPILQRTASRRR